MTDSLDNLIGKDGFMWPNYDLFPLTGTDKYILDENGEPVPEFNIFKWSNWFHFAKNRQVCRHNLGRVDISTVFLGMDHGWGRGLPVLWETMVFGGQYDGYTARYTSKYGAKHGHQIILKMVLTQKRKSRSHAFKVLWKKYLKRYGTEGL